MPKTRILDQKSTYFMLLLAKILCAVIWHLARNTGLGPGPAPMLRRLMVPPLGCLALVLLLGPMRVCVVFVLFLVSEFLDDGFCPYKTFLVFDEV
jgi:hypothetical protein